MPSSQAPTPILSSLSWNIFLSITHNRGLHQGPIRIAHNVISGNDNLVLGHKQIKQTQSIRGNLLALSIHVNPAQIPRASISECVFSKRKCQCAEKDCFMEIECSAWLSCRASVLEFGIGDTYLALVENERRSASSLLGLDNLVERAVYARCWDVC